MRRHIARYVRATAGGERTRHFTARQPAGMLKLDSGTPFFPTPPHIREAGKRALDEGLTGYAPGQGDPEFLQAVCEPLPARDVRARLWDAGVAVRSGTEFGAAGEGHLRFTYSVDEATIEKGMAIVAEVFRRLG